jgi:hypothetical protein
LIADRVNRAAPIVGRTWSEPWSRLRTIVLLVTLLNVPAALLSAQPIDVEGTVTRTAPMFYFRDTSRTPTYVLPAGTSVRIVARFGEWYRVIYHDPKWGDELGYMAVSDVSIQNAAAVGLDRAAGSQRLAQRGFADAYGLAFGQEAPNDPVKAAADFLLREEIFLTPKRWLQVAAGVDVRGNTHDQVADSWRLDVEDRGILRPRLALRRLSATARDGRLFVEVGKQFIRWGRTDILNPTDRFAPRDYVNVINSEFLPVIGVRSSVRLANETIEGVWLPQMTPSRLPLLDQRWVATPEVPPGFTLQDNGSQIPNGAQTGVRWSHTGRFEAAAMFFDGFNHLADLLIAPDVEQLNVALTRTYPALRAYGGDVAVPTAYVTVKGELAYFTSPDSNSDEYVLYVIEVERQAGEWLFDGGYAGEAVSHAVGGVSFNPERGIARSFIGHASYTLDPRKTIAIEGAVKQDGKGVYVKGEYSQSFGRYLRFTIAAVGIGGDDDDFLGQYHHNSHLALSLRFSF